MDNVLDFNRREEKRRRLQQEIADSEACLAQMEAERRAKRDRLIEMMGSWVAAALIEREREKLQ